MTHEPSAGFAADAYARINGIGLVCVTYSWADSTSSTRSRAPMPRSHRLSWSVARRGGKIVKRIRLLHHKVKTFETQRRVYDEVTVASTVLLDEAAGRFRNRALRASLSASQTAGLHRSAARHGRSRNSALPSLHWPHRKDPIRTRSPPRSRKRSRSSAQRRNRSYSPALNWRVIAWLHLVVRDSGADEYSDRGRPIKQERRPRESSALSRRLWRCDEQ